MIEEKNIIKPKQIIKGCLIGISIFSIPLLFFLTIESIVDYYHRNDWKEITTPLPTSTTQLLCDKFDLSLDDKLCNGKSEIYGPDFYDTIKMAFKPFEDKESKNEAATYSEVENKIGKFRYMCEPSITDSTNFSYYRCFYDLCGDKKYVIVIMFTYPDDLVYRISTPMEND